MKVKYSEYLVFLYLGQISFSVAAQKLRTKPKREEKELQASCSLESDDAVTPLQGWILNYVGVLSRTTSRSEKEYALGDKGYLFLKLLGLLRCAEPSLSHRKQRKGIQFFIHKELVSFPFSVYIKSRRE